MEMINKFPEGTVFQNYTVTGDRKRNEDSNWIWPVRCDCGREYWFVKRQIYDKIHKATQYCRACSSEHRKGIPQSAPKKTEIPVPELGKQFLRMSL